MSASPGPVAAPEPAQAGPEPVAAQTPAAQRYVTSTATHAQAASGILPLTTDGILALQRLAGNRAVTRMLVSRAAQPAQDEPPRDQVSGRLRAIIRRGMAQADDGRWLQDDHMKNTRGVVGEVSDWLSDVIPPYIGVWNNAKNLLALAQEQLAAGDLDAALSSTVHGYQLLVDAQRQWSRYVNASIEGAGENIETLRMVRDGAIAVEVGLVTGGASVAGVLVGTAMATAAASQSDTAMGAGIRGTAKEVVNAGVLSNLRLAAHGLVGIAEGTGEGLKDIPAGLVRAAKMLANLFLDPARFVQDIAKLPQAIESMYHGLNNRWEWLSSLPPEEQARQVGRIAGHIEAMLIAIEAGKALGSAGGSAAAAVGEMAVPGTMQASMGGVTITVVVSEQLAVSAQQLATLQAQMAAIGKVGGAVAAVGSAAGGGSGGDGGKTGKGKQNKYGAGDVGPYDEIAAQTGDGLDAHEVLQKVWLDVNGLIKRRGGGVAGSQNPSLALPRDVHTIVGKYQKLYKLHDRAEVAKMSVQKVLTLNAQAMRHAGVPEEIINQVIDEAFDHAIFSVARGY